MLDNKKLMASLGPAALFVLLSHPAVYKITSRFIPGLWDAAAQCPTMLGILVHALVFFLIQKYTIKGASASRHALTGAVMFVVLAHPATYKLVSSLLGPKIAVGGCPSTTGLLVHGAVFAAIVYAMMMRK